MSYTPNTWQSGDVVTSAKLNNMESGIEAAQFPDVTSADAGKVLTVNTGYGDSTVIVPEQSITTNNGVAVITNANTSSFVEGARIELTVFNDTYTGIVDRFLNVYFDDYFFSLYIDIENDNALTFYADEDGTFTISAIGSAPVMQWGVEDDFFLVNIDNTGTGDRTWQEINDALNAKKPCYYAIHSALLDIVAPIISTMYADTKYRVYYLVYTGIAQYDDYSSPDDYFAIE